MKKFLAIITPCLLFFSFTIGCERASLNRIGKDVYYMQIKGEGTIEKVDGRNLRNYTLPAYDEDGVKKQITFRSTKKENNHKLNADAFLRLYVDQDDNNKNEISSIEVKSYEEIQKADLPEKNKRKSLLLNKEQKKMLYAFSFVLFTCIYFELLLFISFSNRFIFSVNAPFTREKSVFDSSFFFLKTKTFVH